MIRRPLRAGKGIYNVTINRREMLRLGGIAAAGAILSTSASSQVLQLVPGPQGLDPLAPQPQQPLAPAAPRVPADIDPHLFAKAKAALDTHRAWPPATDAAEE